MSDSGARALYENLDDGDHDDWDELGDSAKEPWQRAWTAALLALSQDSEAIAEAARRAADPCWLGVSVHRATDVFDAVLQALLWPGPELCEECGVYRADPPSKVCPGCEAYREHQR